MPDRQPPQSFSYAAGEAFVLRFAVDQNIASDTIRFAARPLSDLAADPVLTTADGSAVAALDGTSAFTISVEDEATEDLDGTYRYSAEVEDPGGDKSEVDWGFITFSPKMIERET